MSLSNDLVSQFVSITNDNSNQQGPSILYGTIEYVGATPYVKLDGSDLLTPIVTTASVQPNERVTVTISNHTAVVMGNVSSPAINLETSINNGSDEPIKIGQFGILLAEKANIKELDAAIANIETLKADKAVVNDLSVTIANIETLKADKAIIDDLSAEIANINDLKADKATIDDLSAEIVNINDLKADKASIENLNSIYANIDFANIGEAAIQKLFAQSGIINDLIMSGGKVTGELVGVRIKGDLIEASTLKTDRLVVRGDDGKYYPINTDFRLIPDVSPVEEDMIHGSSLVAESVTAEKVAVEDLVAFGATIGGFKITDNSIRSINKFDVNSNDSGVFLDSTGQVAFGDGNSYLKYYYDATSNSHRLEVAADSVMFGLGRKNVETALNDIQTEVDSIEVGGRNIIPLSIMKHVSGDSTESFTANIWAAVMINTEDLLQIIEPNTEYTLYYEAEIIERTSVPTVYAKTTGFLLYSPSDDSKNRDLYAPDFTSDEVGNKVVFKRTFTTPDTLPSDYRMLVYTRRWTTDGEAPYGFDTIRFTKFKLEKGNKATDWTPAPEDVDETIINSSDEVRQEIVDRSATIVAEAEGIVAEALKSYTKTDDFNSFKEESVSDIKQNAENISLNFTKTTETTTALDKDLQNTKETISKHFEFTENGLTIKMGENAMKLRLDNDLIGFYKGDIDEADLTKNRFGWWDGIDFHTGNIVVEVNERAQFGNFAFVPRSDGSLMFLKVGG